MAINVATLIAELVMDTRKYLGGSQTARRETEKLEKSVANTERATGRLGTAFKLAAAGGAVMLAKKAIAIGKELFNASAQAEAFGRRFDTVFGDAAKAMEPWIDAQNELFGVSEAGLKGMLSQVGDLLVPLGMTRQAAASTSQEVLTLANALSEWTGGQRGAAEVVQILTRAMLGEREALIGLGVKISEADVQARLAEKGLSGLTGEALTQARAMETLALIQERSADALTAYEEGGSDALRVQKDLSAAMQELKESFGDALIALTPLFKMIGDLLAFSGSVVRITFDFVGWLGRNLDPRNLIPGTGFAGTLRELEEEWRRNVAHAQFAEILDAGIRADLAQMAQAGGSISRIIGGLDMAAFRKAAEKARVAFRGPIEEIPHDVFDAFSSLPDVVEESLAELEAAFRGNVEELATWRNNLATLSALGLDAIRQELESAGPSMRNALSEWLLDPTLATLRELDAILRGYRAPSIFLPQNPGIPRGGFPIMHDGGVVPGPVGANVPIIAQAGETILPIGASGGGGGSMTITIQGSDDLTDAIARNLRVATQRGGSLELA